METISTPLPRLDLTRIPAANSQQPTHISRSVCLAWLPQPSPSQGLLDVDMDRKNNNTDTDAFGAGPSTSDLPNTSCFATPVASKHVRVASDEDSSGTKRARLDNVISNSGDDTTPSTSKEKKVPLICLPKSTLCSAQHKNKTRKGERCGTREIGAAARKTTQQVAREVWLEFWQKEEG